MTPSAARISFTAARLCSGSSVVRDHRFDFAEVSEARDLIEMKPHIVARHQGSYFFDYRNRAERVGENSQRPRRICDLDDLVVAQHQRATLFAMVENQNCAAVFLAQFQLAVGDTEKRVALMEYRAPRVSDRRRARLGVGMIRERELCFQVLH